MSFQDKTIQCSDCGADFIFSIRDQEFFQSKGFANEPKRCPECRDARKSQRQGNYEGGNYGASRPMFPVTCASCSISTQVPFQPRGDKPVYCSDCYRKTQPAR